MANPGTMLITGASAGIGRELAKLGALDQRPLVLVARRRDRLDQLAGELRREHGVAVTVVPADLAQPGAASAIFDQVSAAGIEIECLVNNAGFGARGKFVELELPRQLEMIDVNMGALVALTHRFAPGMIARRAGRILNVASVAAFVPGPYMAVYYASKAFVLSFTEAVATELRGTGVTVTAACPGPTATEFGDVAGSTRTKLFRRGVADAASVAKHAYRAMLAGRVVAVPGVMNWLLTQAIRIGPRSTIRSIAAGMNLPPH